MARRTSKKVNEDAKNASREVRLLSGGNPQIAKGDGDAAVQVYIATVQG